MKSLLAAALVFVTPSMAADKDPFLDHMAGNWVLSGTIENQPTTHDVSATWVLQNTYLRFVEVSREKDASGKPLYEAEVLLGYDAAKKRYACFWFDVTGVAGPGSGGVASRDGDRLPFVFKSASGDFHTTFTYQSASDSWGVTMDADNNGQLVSFARLTMTKAR